MIGTSLLFASRTAIRTNRCALGSLCCLSTSASHVAQNDRQRRKACYYGLLTLGATASVVLSYNYKTHRDNETSKTSCDAALMLPPGGAATRNVPLSSFQIFTALETRDEMQKVRMARLLRDIYELAKESQKAQLVRRASSRMQRQETERSREEGGRISLRGVNLSKLTTDQAKWIIDSLLAGGKLDRKSALAVAKAAVKVLRKDETLVDLRGVADEDKVTVVGDLHGSLSCLENVLEVVGDLDDPSRVLVAAGDYVDRGDNSLEVFFTLLLLKLAHPRNVVLLRGNHEDVMIASVYGFLDEIREKYGTSWDSKEVWDSMGEVFAALPICARTETALMLHGGLPGPDFELERVENISVDDRCRIQTCAEPRTEHERLVEDLTWSDPSPDDGVAPSPRGCGVLFGPDVARDFLKRHNLKYIVRGHEPAEQGSQLLDCGDGRGVITVFSTADYPNGEGSNLGAVVKLDKDGYKSIEFAYSGKRVESDELPYEAALREYIYDHRHKLEKAFLAVESGRHVTKSQWARIMCDELDLPYVTWETLQPSLAPALDEDENLIDWRTPLKKSAVRQPIDDEELDTLQDNREQLLNIFKFLDRDGNGSVDYDEFVSGIEILNSRHLPKDKQVKEPEKLFRQLDIDGNGEIELSEFAQVLKQSSVLSSVTDALDHGQLEALQENHEMLLVAFQFLDADGNGTIDRKEFGDCMALLNRRLPKNSQVRDPDELFNKIDVDGNGEIDLEEFNQIFEAL